MKTSQMDLRVIGRDEISAFEMALLTPKTHRTLKYTSMYNQRDVPDES